ncbi:CGNR zinc finger domain-containing protein [Streptomyces djakartensis]|uniref:CGNR zinc finger domain-containing protein n=1 Tax=Streptomyces djakartensis TaxID=68193 RepID=UPI0034DE2283
MERPGDVAAASGVDAILDCGCVRPTLTADGPGEIIRFPDTAWGPAWTAAYSHLGLPRAPDRIRGCAHPSWALHFLDTSRNGTRRWCSMAVCGNRAKASRRHARSRGNRRPGSVPGRSGR